MDRLHDNSRALDTINGMIEQDIRVAAKAVIRDRDTLNLKSLLKFITTPVPQH